MAYLLNIETATKNCSVGLAEDGQTIACLEVAGQGYSHAEKLHVFVQQVVREAGITLAQLDAVAVGQGPGSYTGLRIGVSAAKGLCYALGKPLIAVDTLEILARQLEVSEGSIVPMLDARRMEVYASVFDSEFHQMRKTEAEVIDENAFSHLEGPVYFVGDAVEKCKTVLKSPNFVFREDIVFPSAREMSALSFEKFRNRDFVDLAYFEPFYLKAFFLQQ